MQSQAGVLLMGTLGQRLRRLRKERTEYSIDDVARKIGTTFSSVGKYERDEQLPPADKLTALAQLYQTTTDYLLGLTDDPSPPPRGDTVAAWSPSGYDKLTPEQRREVDAFVEFLRHKYRKGGPFDRGGRGAD